jgi:hypothetical protein
MDSDYRINVTYSCLSMSIACWNQQMPILPICTLNIVTLSYADKYHLASNSESYRRQYDHLIRFYQSLGFEIKFIALLEY